MYIWGITKKYKVSNWYENFMSGHISIGKFTWFGENAMLWAMEYRTKKWGYVVFKPPIRTFGKYHGWWFYLSPNGTPWASTYYIGVSTFGAHDRNQTLNAKIRKHYLGHGFDSEKYSKKLSGKINYWVMYRAIELFDVITVQQQRKEKLQKINQCQQQ